jgi:exopolysaccharide production protein ExoZ
MRLCRRRPFGPIWTRSSTRPRHGSTLIEAGSRASPKRQLAPISAFVPRWQPKALKPPHWVAPTHPLQPIWGSMLKSLQLCRALAALLVVLFHVGGTLASPKYFDGNAGAIARVFRFGGTAGVTFFFVLSGFIIFYAHAEDFNRPSMLPAYLLKRARRIFPSYWIVFLTVCALMVLVPSLRDSVPKEPTILLKSLLLLPQDSAVVGGTGAPVIVVAWSLQYEVIFYLAFAIGLISKRLFYGLILAYLGCLVMHVGSTSSVLLIRFALSHLVLLFLFGMMASSAFRSKPSLRVPQAIASAAALAFAAIATCDSVWNVPTEWSDVAYGVVSAVLIWALASWEARDGGLKSARFKSISSLGDSSYALYLIHFPLASVLAKGLILFLPQTTLGSTIAFLAIVIICVATALLFHRFIESPMLRRLR